MGVIQEGYCIQRAFNLYFQSVFFLNPGLKVGKGTIPKFNIYIELNCNMFFFLFFSK